MKVYYVANKVWHHIFGNKDVAESFIESRQPTASQRDLEITEFEIDEPKEIHRLREALERKETVALSNVLYERKRQDEKWGEQNHNPYKWIAILLEELGEASKDLLENERIKYRDEMVQVAAVALAAIESYDRQALEGGE